MNEWDVNNLQKNEEITLLCGVDEYRYDYNIAKKVNDKFVMIKFSNIHEEDREKIKNFIHKIIDNRL